MELADKLAKEAESLRPVDRIKLVESILSSLDKPNPEIEKNWVKESDARYEAYKRGEIDATDWEKIKDGFGN